jgi:hypothetical protein
MPTLPTVATSPRHPVIVFLLFFVAAAAIIIIIIIIIISYHRFPFPWYFST